MTGYHITVGYMSNGNYDEAARAMIEAAESIRHDPNRLSLEVTKLPFIAGADGHTLWDFCAVYSRPPEKGGPVTIKDDPHESQVWVAASGGGRSRAMKEQVARAFCRLMLAAMHRKGFEVNVHVA